MATGHCQLPTIRQQVGLALEKFLDGQRVVLGDMGPELLPWLDAVAALLAGGKRLRPAFCYWGWRAAGGPDTAQIYTAAAALELLHASALVHDDLIDGSDTRRGRPAVHRQFAARHADQDWRGPADAFGAGTAILVGDMLLGWTDELLAGSGLEPPALRRAQPVLYSMRAELIGGQYLDLIGQAAGDGSVAEALRVIRYKTASYTVARPLQLGAALAGPTDGPVVAACRGYGVALGIAFQLRDDVLGAFGDPAQTGKPSGDDLREGKRTVLVAIARERATPAQRRVLGARLGDPRLDQPGVAEVRAVLSATGALAECERMIEASVAEALSAIEDATFPGQAREALAELAVVATARSG
ncbi:MAG TPA: polyprenyl synthetase family protein [Streptosporangiaceae bacterium]|nr:polyprenyl synthetase family protein [Streptosporangiaceae bacterium]